MFANNFIKYRVFDGRGGAGEVSRVSLFLLFNIALTFATTGSTTLRSPQLMARQR